MNLQGKSKFFYHIWFGRIFCVFFTFTHLRVFLKRDWKLLVVLLLFLFVSSCGLLKFPFLRLIYTFRNDLNTTTLRAFDYTSFLNFILWNPPTAKSQGVLWPRAVLETRYSRAIWILFWLIWALVIWTHRLKLCIYQCEWKILIIQKLW